MTPRFASLFSRLWEAWHGVSQFATLTLMLIYCFKKIQPLDRRCKLINVIVIQYLCGRMHDWVKTECNVVSLPGKNSPTQTKPANRKCYLLGLQTLLHFFLISDYLITTCEYSNNYYCSNATKVMHLLVQKQ